jgi:hypothetical protein
MLRRYSEATHSDWPFRSFSPILFAASIVSRNTSGEEKNKQGSESEKLKFVRLSVKITCSAS